MQDAINLHYEVSQWLFNEAALLDRSHYDRWLALLDDDIRYFVPVRVSKQRDQGEDVVQHARHFDENLFTLTKRVKRFESLFCWAEDPPSRTRHFVTNIQAEARTDGTIAATSSLFLHRSRGDSHVSEQLSAERQDVLVRVDGALRLRLRTVLVDHSTLPVQNMAILL